MQGRPKGVHFITLADMFFAEQNGTTDEHRFTCVGGCVGKSKCGTVWNVAQRNGITGYSCCAVLKVGKWNEERMKCTYRRHMAVGGITLLI